jgi:hypothetical protein
MSKVIIAAAIMVICLYFVKIDGIIGIVLSIIGGVIIFGATLILLRAFSEQEKQLIKHILFGLISKKNRN